MILPKVRDPRFITIRRSGSLTNSDHQLLALWAAACAEHVLHLFERVQPSDPRPRWAIAQAPPKAMASALADWSAIGSANNCPKRFASLSWTISGSEMTYAGRRLTAESRPSSRMIAFVLGIVAAVPLLYAQSTPATLRDSVVTPLPGPVVDVTGGTVRGARLPGGGAVFLGIPYARPPVGALRWREPSPVESWTGVRNAIAYGPPCAQNPYFNPKAKDTAREDCLYLNVWTPDVTVRERGRPVMVWIPGGGNFAGGSDERMSGEKLMHHDVIVVTLNYRLGLFGFFSHPQLTRESPHHSSGNQGILDQLAALRWVKANIARFGGDPSNVTIFGESAGSVNVSVLMTSPLARGLFNRAIGQSGSVVIAGEPLSLKEAESRGVSLAEAWGAGAKPSIDVLRARPMTAILKGEPNFLEKPQPNLGITIDGYVFPVSPASVFIHGRELRVPMLLGNLAHEWVPGVQPPPNLKEAIVAAYPAAAAKRALSLYVGSGTDSLYGTPAEQWVEDVGFRCPGIAQLTWHATAGNVAYAYQIEHVPLARRRGNAHSADVPYVFGTIDGEGYGAADHAMSELMRKYWTNFAKTGNPNEPGVPTWPSFDPTSRAYVAFTDEGAAARKGLRRPFCDLFLESASR